MTPSHFQIKKIKANYGKKQFLLFMQVRTLEQRKEIEELSAQVAELEQLRKKQARKIHELKSEVDTTIHSSDENRVVADNAVQALSSELRTTKAALMAIQNREKAVSFCCIDFEF